MSERFRTQPITSAERFESDRYGRFLEELPGINQYPEHDGCSVSHSGHDSILCSKRRCLICIFVFFRSRLSPSQLQDPEGKFISDRAYGRPASP